MKNLFPDQQQTVNEVLSAFDKEQLRSIILCAPTGSGKTVMASWLAKHFVEKKGTRVLMLSDRIFLNNSFYESLTDAGLVPFNINGKKDLMNIGYNLYVSTSQTLKSRIKSHAFMDWIKKSIDYVFIDECHKEEFNVFFEIKIFEKAKVIGLSATPEREGKQRQLAEDYQKIILGTQIQDLISLKRLSKPTYIEDKSFRVSSRKIKTKWTKDGLEYDGNEVEKIMTFSKVGNNAIELFKQHGDNKRGIAFCAGSANTIEMCVKFSEAGIPSMFYISPPKEEKGIELYNKYYHKYSGTQEAVTGAHKRGEFVLLFNNQIFTTGYDDPYIENVLILKMTLSYKLLMQMIGRGSRFLLGIKESFRVFDLSDNLYRLKYWHYPRKFSLVHKRGGVGQPPLKLCPKCKQYSFATQKICSHIHPQTMQICNFTFPTLEKIDVNINATVVNYDDLMYGDFIKQRHKMTWEQIDSYRKAKGFKYQWMFQVATQINRIEEFRNTPYYELMKQRITA